MKTVFFALFYFIIPTANAQNDINWDGHYQLQLSDFRSPATQVGHTDVYSLHALCGPSFSLSMNGVQFMLTKNFNSKVDNVFKRNIASLVSPDSVQVGALLEFARYEFDLSELYARKFRKKIFEEKESLSNISFIKPLFDAIQQEFAQRDTDAGKETEVGRKSEKLKTLHEQVLAEIAELADFCKSCKPRQKK